MPSRETWERVVEQAWAGEARHLLELLLAPQTTDNAGAPAGPSPFNELPQDAELRLAIVRVLIFGPWRSQKKGMGATTIRDLMLKTGWGRGKPSLSEYEVGAAAVFVHLGGSIEQYAEAVDLKPETLQRRTRALRKKRQGI